MSVSLLLMSFSAGILAASYLPILLPLGSLWLLLPGLLLVIAWRKLICLWLLMLGLGWGIYSGHQLLSSQLDNRLEGQTLQVSGWVGDIPEADSRKIRFLIHVDKAPLAASGLPETFPDKLQLSWYWRSGQQQPDIIPGEYLSLQVRLKRPRGFVNPGGFDYQAWLLRRGIGATGYVVSGELATNPSSSVFIQIDKWRWQLQQWVLTNCRGSECGILVALLIGDTSQVDKNQWLRMQQTGTSHLIAISGLHVGFLAIVGYWCGLLLGRLMQLCGARVPAQRCAYINAILFSGFYSALAGFNIPTLRTMIMLAVFYLAAFWYRPVRLTHIYFFALSLVLMLDPLAAFDMGFWLSFGAVAVLLVSFSGRYAYGNRELQSAARAGSWLRGYTRSQWVLFIGLLVPLGLLVNSSPLLAPVANFIAIPLVTFFVVPCLLLGAALALVDKGQWLLGLAEWGMELLKHWLEVLFSLGQGEWALLLMPVLSFELPAVVLLLLASLLLLLPAGLIPKWLGYAGLFMGLGFSFLPDPQRPELELAVMDVGQGTAVVISTPNYHLVYDTGPRFSEDFDAGAGILLPYLRNRGIRHLDAIVVSHSDMDHAGGLQGLTGQMKAATIWYGEPPLPNDASCHEQPSWQWDQVHFRFLHWPVTPGSSANNHSCVLLVEYKDQRILLPGDIESSAEWALLRGDELPGNLSVLLAAHHGSRTSSNPAFVVYTKPEWVIYSAGYNNQHGHPHPQIQERFRTQGARSLNTAWQGALIFRWWPARPVEVVAARQEQKRYWHEPMPADYVLP